MSCENTNDNNDDPSSSTNNQSIYYNMLGSMTAGFISRVPAHPLDTCKAKLQVQQTLLSNDAHMALAGISNIDPHIHSKYLSKIRKVPIIGHLISGNPTLYHAQPLKNTINALTKTFQREGIAGLYRGFAILAVGSCPGTCLYFTSYEWTRRNLNEYEFFKNKAYLSDFIGGFMAEICACILFVPIDVIKERMQVQSIIDPKFRYKGTMEAISRMIEFEGMRGLYRAYGATIVSFGPFSALNLMGYEQLKYLYSKYKQIDIKEINPWMIACCGCTSAGMSAVVTNPLDMVKLRMQVQRGGIYNFGYDNIWDGLHKLVKYEKFQSLFHGAGARAAFWIPCCGITLTTYETCTRFYQRNFNFD